LGVFVSKNSNSFSVTLLRIKTSQDRTQELESIEFNHRSSLSLKTFPQSICL